MGYPFLEENEIEFSRVEEDAAPYPSRPKKAHSKKNIYKICKNQLNL